MFWSSFAFGLIAYFLGQMGNSGVWCWIKNKDISGQILQWVSFILAYSSGLINLTFSIRLFIYFTKKKIIEPEEAKKRKGIISKLLRYPIIQIISIFPSTINRIYAVITEKNSIVLGDISLFFEWFQGIFIIITFWINEGFLTFFTQCCPKKEEQENKTFERNNVSLIGLEELIETEK